MSGPGRPIAATPAKPFIVDGVLYPSLTQAARELGFSSAAAMGQAARLGKLYRGHAVEFGPVEEWEPKWKEAR